MGLLDSLQRQLLPNVRLTGIKVHYPRIPVHGRSQTYVRPVPGVRSE